MAVSPVPVLRAAPGTTGPNGDRTASASDFLVAFGCGQTNGLDPLVDAAASACPPGLEDMIIEEAERLCGGGELTVYYVVCRYLGNGWWDVELRGRCD